MQENWHMQYLRNTSFPFNKDSSEHAGIWENTSRVGKHEAQPSGFPTLLECSPNFPSL